jgi:alpha-tubulin suppressor-like RCC1 family protein
MAMQQYLMMGRSNSDRMIHTGEMHTMGSNPYGQLGDGATALTSLPVQVGALTDWQNTISTSSLWGATVTVKSDGTMWGMGYNGAGQLGVGDTTNRSSPTQIGSDTDWKEVVGKYQHVTAIKTDGTMWGFGYNNYGQLGVGDQINRSSPTQIGSDTDWAHVIGGNAATWTSAAFKTDGSVYFWGHWNLTLAMSTPVQIGSDTDWVDGVTAGQDQPNNNLILWKDA